jgi:hypothetical protein
MISGWLASARAQATRCCCPPDSSVGRWWSRWRRPTVSMTTSSHAGSGCAAGDVHRQRDVLERRQRRQQVEGLEDEADLVPAQRREPLVVQTAECGVADDGITAAERVETGHAVHERRLARPGRAHDRCEAAAGEGDVDGVERDDAGVTVAVHLGQRASAGGGHGSGEVVEDGHGGSWRSGRSGPLHCSGR